MNAESLNHLPIFLKPEYLCRSANTKVFDLPTSGYVLKADLSVAKKSPSPSIFDVLTFIKNMKEREQIAMTSFPASVFAPREHHFIAEGENGIPTAFRIQKKVIGKRVMDIPVADMSKGQKNALGSLFWNGFKSVLQGTYLDLVGSTGDESYSRWKYIKRSLTPLANSSNILIADDGAVAWIDVKSSQIPSSPKWLVWKAIWATGYLKDGIRLKVGV